MRMQRGIRRFIIAWMLSLFTLHGATARQRLAGSIPAAARQRIASGRLPATNVLKLAIGLPLRNRAELEALLQQLYDPTSPNFRRYLSMEEFTGRYGPTPSDYEAAAAFAQANGLRITRTHPNRLILDVEGSVPAVEQAFQIRLNVYSHPTEPRIFYAPDTEPTVAAGVRLLQVSGLHNYRRARPMSLRERTGEVSPASPRAGSGTGGTYLGKDFRSAYVPGTTWTGAGQVLGLFELEGYFSTDITAYKKLAALPDVPLQNILINGFNGIPAGRQSGSDNEEVALDIEMAIAMAPGLSKVLVYEGPPNSTLADIDDLLNRMATDNLAKQLSCSWGFDIDAIIDQVFEQFAAQGQSFFLASGDAGAFVGQVSQPSDNPFITVVGGTVLKTDSSHAWVSETTWSSSGGGVSQLFPLPYWQSGLDFTENRGSAEHRNVPDVAMVADDVVAIVDRGVTKVFSGTSIAAPLWAGFTALANQQGAAQGKPPLGFVNPAFYSVGRGVQSAGSFHDITTGNNSNADSQGLFAAVPGYDLCTGWGSPAGTNLINALLAFSPGNLVVESPLGFTAVGPTGGPFNIASQDYTLSNTGKTPIHWLVENVPPWLTVSSTGGILLAGQPPIVVTVALSAAATNVLVGSFEATLAFQNWEDGTHLDRAFRLLVDNGGFETGDFTHWRHDFEDDVNFVSSIDISRFVPDVGLPGVPDDAFVHSGYYGAFLGQNTTLGSLAKTLPTVPGQRYRISFWFTNPLPGNPNAFQTWWDGVSILDLTDMAGFEWRLRQFTLTATGANTDLEFRFRNDDNAIGLEDVRVEVVPPLRFDDVQRRQGAVQLRWTGLPALGYQVQFNTDLGSANWQNLGEPSHSVDGNFSVLDADGSQQRFYRLIDLP